MKQLTSSSFHSFISSGRKMVQFSAQWCFDCKRVAFSLPALEKTIQPVIQLAELDVDESRDIAQAYGVKGVPTFVVFCDGQEVARLMSKEAKKEENIARFFVEQRQQTPLP
jgi:thioredoxin-like negative regulator of GroEL